MEYQYGKIESVKWSRKQEEMNKGERMYIAQKITVDADEVREFAANFCQKVQYLADLGSPNRLLLSSINREDAFLFYEKATKLMLDVDVDGQITHQEFAAMLLEMRMSFMATYSVFMNCLLTPGRYAAFKGISEDKVRVWMKTKEADIVVISGRRFILLQVDEIMNYNYYMMKEYLEQEPISVRQRKKREIEAEIFKNFYDIDLTGEITDTVKMFMYEQKMLPVSGGRSYERQKRYSIYVYNDYRRWCLLKGKIPVPMRNFSGALNRMGYDRFNTRKRGFYVWVEVEEIGGGGVDLAGLYSLDEVEVPKEDTGCWKLPDFSAGWDGEENLSDEDEEDVL